MPALKSSVSNVSTKSSTSLSDSASIPFGYSAAVDRSTELLSCAQTALKIAKQRHHQRTLQQQPNNNGNNQRSKHYPNEINPALLELNPQDLKLASATAATTTTATDSSLLLEWQEECLTLLRSMDQLLHYLQTLVRRSGQTNDPTNEIAQATRQFEQTAQTLKQYLQQPPNNNNSSSSSYFSAQASRHVQFVVEWCSAIAQQQAQKLQATIKIRAQVLQAQAKRRQQFTTTTSAATAASSTSSLSANAANHAGASSSRSSILERNPLFTQKLPPPRNSRNHRTNVAPPVSATTNGHNHKDSGMTNVQNNFGSSQYTSQSSTASAATSSYYGTGSTTAPTMSGYGGSIPSLGGSSLRATGMRQRRPGGTNKLNRQQQIENDEQESYMVQQQPPKPQQQQQQQQMTATSNRRRLQDARQAAQTLHTIGTLFGKMSNLIAQQGEVLEKVEDDVEAASTYVQAGQEEITTLYSIKKGNRALILKVFGVLIFLICFLRFYKK